MNSSAENIPWIFIPFPPEVVLDVRGWIHRLAPKESDDILEKNCEELIKKAFLTHELTYNSDKYGEIRMNILRILLSSDGICVPEHCFVDPPAKLKRVQMPLSPFIRNA